MEQDWRGGVAVFAMDGANKTGIALYWTDTLISPGTVLGCLKSDEIARFRRIRRAADRARFAVGAVMLRKALARQLGIAASDVSVDRTCPVCGDPHGKPVPVDSGVWCSVAHSAKLVIIAVSNLGPIGVDVEDLSRTIETWRSMAEQLVYPGELLPRDKNAFLRFWTAKEAVIKATGEGLNRPMRTIRLGPSLECFRTPHTRVVGVLAPSHLDNYAVLTRTLETSCVSVASAGGLSDLSLEYISDVFAGLAEGYGS